MTFAKCGVEIRNSERKINKTSQKNNGQRDRRMTISTIYIGNIETTTFTWKPLYTSLDSPIQFPKFTHALHKHICKWGPLRLESVENKSKGRENFFEL